MPDRGKLVGIKVAAATMLVVGAPAASMACSPSMQAQNAMMHGKPPDCYDRNTLAIYGDRALTEGAPPAEWLARQKRRVAKRAAAEAKAAKAAKANRQ